MMLKGVSATRRNPVYSASAVSRRILAGLSAEGVTAFRGTARSGRGAVSIMSTNGVPIQDISDTMGHKLTHVTERPSTGTQAAPPRGVGGGCG